MVIRFISYIVLTTSILFGCTGTQTKSYDGPTITCAHKYDESIVIKYPKGNITRFITNDVVTFYILDVNNKDVYLNIYEIENYICEESL